MADLIRPSRSEPAARSSTHEIASANGAEPAIVTYQPAGLEPRSRVEGGLDVWEYVLVARDYGWDVAQTAAHLREPEARVSAALQHYRQDSTEVDAWLQHLDEVESDPTRFYPRIKVVGR